jgi:uncharacterized protein
VQRSRRHLTLVIAGLVLLALVFLPALIQFATDWLWYQEIGYQTVFTRERIARLLLFFGTGLAVFAFFYANLRLAQRGVVPDPVVVRINPDAPPVDFTQALRRLSLPVAGFLAFLFAGAASSGWLMVLRALNAGTFGTVDPVFGRDIGYYVFTMPLISGVLGMLITATVLATLMVVPIYFMRGDLILPPRRTRVEPSAALHLGALICAFFVLTAVNIWFVRTADLLYSTTGPIIGASYSDLAARLPALRVSAVIALLAAIWVAVGIARQKLVWHVAVAAGAYAIVSIVGGALIPAALQRLVVLPNEIVRESPQIASHIAATRQAWGIDAVQVRDITSDDVLTAAHLEENAPTIDNVRLWDREPLLQTIGQLQAIRTYYEFTSVHDDRYWINGQYRQVLLSPRELNTASLPQRTFINEHLVFTHGMGVTVAPVNQVTPEGLPVLFVQDLPPSSSVDLPVTRPQIYFGELTNSFIFVNTRQDEFDYPAADEPVMTRYSGDAGVPLNGLLRKLLMAVRFQSAKIVLSDDITSESRILYHRNVRERARQALPFLQFDEDPYMVIDSAGALFWIMDAYTRSSRYPYSTRAADGTNYMRNSVKVTLDAYNGTVVAYLVDEHDPLARTYDRIFPGILRPMTEMPNDLRAHLRYPEDLYRLQTTLYRVYHMDSPAAFYHREDEWYIPEMERRGARDLFMRRIILRLPGEEHEEFIFMTPFTPRQRDNLAAWMVARSDGERYGELLVYRFPKQSLVYGPRQVVNRINQHTEIAQQISLWDQRGSEVIRGELLVIPIAQTLIYVQPLYLRAQGGRIPELKRVMVAYQNRVVMEETLEDALSVLFGTEVQRPTPTRLAAGAAPGAAAPGTPGTPPATPRLTGLAADAGSAAIVRRAQEHYDRAMAAQRAGNWATYGTEIEQLGQLLRQLNGVAP